MANEPDTSTRDLVQERFGIAQNYSDDAWDRTLEFLQELGEAASGFELDLSELLFTRTIVPVAVEHVDRPTAPAIDPDDDLPAHPVPAELTGATIDPVAIPTLTAPPPEITYPEAPDFEIPADPGDVPDVSVPDLPAAPSYELPAPPTLDDLALPPAPELSALPSFEGETPVNDLTPPDNLYLYGEVPYQSELKDELYQKIRADLEAGGTGLGAEVEQAIWDRAKARQELVNERVYREAEEYWAARGWSMPPGALAARLTEALKEQTRADTDLNEKIAIEQAQLAKEHQQFIISSGLQMENQLMDFANQVAGRAFESAKFTAQIAVDIFNAQVQKYNADLETYKTEAAVYESRIRAGLLELERHKAQLEGVRLSADIRAQAVEVYRLRLAGVETLVNLYRTEMESARIRSDVEMKRIEAFRSKVDAFTAKIGAKTAEFNLYQARIAGEQAKAEVYSRQVEAFGRQVDAAKTEADVRIAEAGAVLEADRQKIEKYRADIEMYDSEVKKAIGKAEVLARLYDTDVESYDAAIRAAVQQAELRVKNHAVQMDHETNQLGVKLKEAEINMNALLAQHQTQLKTIEAGMNVAAQLTASALSAVNASAQMGYSSSDGHSTTHHDDTVHKTESRVHHYEE